MEAGKELDALVAEKVMGIAPSEWPWGCHAEGHTMDEDVWCYTCGMLYSEGERVPPPYSSSISAAWRVVEKMRSGGWLVSMLGMMEGAWEGRYHASFRHVSQSEFGMHVRSAPASSAMSAPHAICLAALEAVGHSP